MKKGITAIGALVAAGAGWSLYRNKKYPLLKEYRIFNKIFIPGSVMKLGLLSIANNEREKLLLKNPVLLPEGLVKRTAVIKSEDGAAVNLTIYEPEHDLDEMPCLVYFHGGAFVLKDVPYIHKYMTVYAKEGGCKVVFVHYRTSDTDPFPIPFQDCYAGLRYVWENSTALNVDRDRIAVGGDSAGGALAAAAALRARDEGTIKLCYQMLIYPAADLRMQSPSMKKYTDSPVWNARLSKRMWKLYLRDGDHGQIAYASPMLADDFSGLPDAYVEVEEFDCLHDEGIAYAEQLRLAGAQVNVNDLKGTCHGYDVMTESAPAKAAVKQRCDALRKAFYS